MAFSVETTTGLANNGSGGGITHPVTVTSANLLLVGLTVGSADHASVGTIDVPTYNGVAMTLIASSAVSDGNWAGAAWFRTINPTAGTLNVVVGSGHTQMAIHVISFIDADVAGTPLGTPSTATNTTANPSVTVADSASGNIVVSAHSNDNGGGATTQTSGTLIFEVEDLGADVDLNAQYQTASGGNTACTWTNAGSGSGWAASGVAVKGVSSGTSILRQMMNYHGG